MGKKSLPPGFRFHPTDVELVMYYLKRKVLGKKVHFDAIAEVDIYKYTPWDLPDKSCLRTGDLKWYFFCPREKKYASGTRMNRATDIGYWKTTGKDRTVHYNNEVVGMIKTLVFHRGKAPKGDRTDWVMYEYRLQQETLDSRGVAQDAYVLCSVFKKDGPGPRNGAQYGAPFKEEEWDDDDVDAEVNVAEVFSSAVSSASVPINQNNSIIMGAYVPDSICAGSSALCPSEPLASVLNPVVGDVDNIVASAEPSQDANDNDEILALLANFSEETPFTPSENILNAQGDNINYGGHFVAGPCSDGIDIYNNLGDLGSLAGFDEHEDNLSNCTNANYPMEQMLSSDNVQFLELMDLDVPLNISIEAGGYGHLQTGGLYADGSCFINPEESCSVANPCSCAEVVVDDSQSVILPMGLNVFESQVNVFNQDNGIFSNYNQEHNDYEAGLFKGTANLCNTFGMGNAHVLQAARREGDAGDFLFVMN